MGYSNALLLRNL